MHYGSDAPSQAESEVTATLKEFSQAQRQQTEKQKEVARLDLLWDRVAVAWHARSIKATEPEHSEFPEWAGLVDWSHDLRYEGGLIMSFKCGSLACISSMKSLFFQQRQCRNARPPGSESRLQRFLRGRLTFASSHWPCGINTKLKLDFSVWQRPR